MTLGRERVGKEELYGKVIGNYEYKTTEERGKRTKQKGNEMV